MERFILQSKVAMNRPNLPQLLTAYFEELAMVLIESVKSISIVLSRGGLAESISSP